MDPLSVISSASTVIQLLHHVTEVARRFERGRPPGQGISATLLFLKQVLASFDMLETALQQGTPDRHLISNEVADSILHVLTACKAHTIKLEAISAALAPGSEDDMRVKIKKALLFARTDRKIQRLSAALKQDGAKLQIRLSIIVLNLTPRTQSSKTQSNDDDISSGRDIPSLTSETSRVSRTIQDSELAHAVSEKQKSSIQQQFSQTVVQQFADLPHHSVSMISKIRARVPFTKKVERYSVNVTAGILARDENIRKMNITKTVYWRGSVIAEDIVERAFPSLEHDTEPENTWASLEEEPIPMEEKMDFRNNFTSLRNEDFEHVFGTVEESELETRLGDMLPDPLERHTLSTNYQDDEEILQYMIDHQEFDKLARGLRDIAQHYCFDTMSLIERSITVKLESPKTSKAVFHAKWNIREFVEQYDADLKDFGHILAITGNSHDAQMCTVECYLQQTWPEESFNLLETLQEVLFGGRAPDDKSTPKRLDVVIEKDVVRVTAYGSPAFICIIGQQLAWLGSVCQFPDSGLRYCDTLWSVREPTVTDTNDGAVFEIDYHVAPFDKDETKMCWHSLVTDSTIATGFPIPRRSVEDHGLQVPIDVLAALAGVSIAVDIGAGYFIKGEYCALYPTRKKEDDNHVQWHFFDNGDELLDYENLKKRIPDLKRQENLSLEEVNSTIAFVGWTPRVTNCAATDNIDFLDYSQIRESKADKLGKISVTISGGSISVAKIASFGVNWSLSRRKIPPSSREIKSYGDILYDLRSRNVILYDTEAKRSWLIDGEQAALQVILHRSKIRRGYVESHVRIAAADPKRGVSAEKAMLANERLQLRKDWDASKGKEMAIGFSGEVQVVSEYLKELTSLAHAEYGSLSWSQITTGGRRIIGYDYLDLTTAAAEFHHDIKQVVLESDCGEWPQIAKAPASIVLFAKTFQEVLRPQVKTDICPKFRELPSGRSYLAAEIKTIHEVLKNTTVSWTSLGSCFTICKRQGEDNCTCNLVQELVKAGMSNASKPGNCWNDGAVIFGAITTKLQKDQRTGKPIHQELSIISLGGSSAKLLIPKPLLFMSKSPEPAEIGLSKAPPKKTYAPNLLEHFTANRTIDEAPPGLPEPPNMLPPPEQGGDIVDRSEDEAPLGLPETPNVLPPPEHGESHSLAHREARNHWASWRIGLSQETQGAQAAAPPLPPAPEHSL